MLVREGPWSCSLADRSSNVAGDPACKIRRIGGFLARSSEFVRKVGGDVVSPFWSDHLERYGARFGQTGAAWRTLTFYERFEQVISILLTVLISLVVVGAVLNLSYRIAVLLIFGLIDPAEQELFHAIFGMVLTVLIALELNHSILGVLERKKSIIQVRTVVLVSLLALVRKFIILDAGKTEPLTIIGLALAVVALGTVYWLVRDQDRKEAADA
jgi:uncharacterized membrane protein (DUF373 family)